MVFAREKGRFGHHVRTTTALSGAPAIIKQGYKRRLVAEKWTARYIHNQNKLKSITLEFGLAETSSNVTSLVLKSKESTPNKREKFPVFHR